MNFLRPLGWIDPWDLSIVARKLQGRIRGEHGVRRLILIDGPKRDHDYTKSGTLRNAITRARRIAEQGNLELVRAEIEQLDGGAHIPWETGEDELAVHVGIVGNPLAILYSGNEGMTVTPGQIIGMSMLPLHSAVNAGETARIDLVLTLRSRLIEDDQE